MSLTNKQKKWIVQKKNKLSAEKIAEELKVNKADVVEFLKLFSEKKTPIYFYLILIGVPVLFFILLEGGLRIFNYGESFEQWVNPAEGKYILNPNYAKRYFFNTKSIPYSDQDVFDVKKKNNAFRVFVLGGSSAAGYPFLPNGAFSRYIRERLKLLYPSKEIEVVNIAMTAINSYSLADMFDGVLKQKPDLIIFYAGHNEYYGALGIGSMESLGSSGFIVKLMLSLSNFRTYQLVRNTVKNIVALFNKNKSGSGTLMSRIVADQYIEFKSDKYFAGVKQFEDNMTEMLFKAKKNKVNVLIGTLASNLKDQKPFISKPAGKYPAALDVFKQAGNVLEMNNKAKADSLFRFAKDLDQLRFRAPEDINYTIKKLGKKFNYPVVNIDSIFAARSPSGITGNNLMTDHLHPTFEGYQIIGQAFFNSMEKNNLLPGKLVTGLSEEDQHKKTLENLRFSKLDSTISSFRIAALKNDWPFISKEKKRPLNSIIKLKNFIDSTAYLVEEGKLEWEEAHRRVAGWYVSNKKYAEFEYEMEVLISQFPVIVEYYNSVANELLKAAKYDEALKYLELRYKQKPDAFSTKWIAIIELSKHNTDKAIKFFIESISMKGDDAQVYYNLAGAYLIKKNYKAALNAINKCLNIDSSYKGASELQKQLAEYLKKQNH